MREKQRLKQVKSENKQKLEDAIIQDCIKRTERAVRFLAAVDVESDINKFRKINK